ncbi:MAG: hypothetical protein JW884_14720, partial [Deltaproteobacteria bacterium]|nr:hypothetical protein [Deltaproteobacteria bacterium]
ICLIVLYALCAIRIEHAWAGSRSPIQWRVGDSWLVEAQYLRMGSQFWDDKVYTWIYTVESPELYGNRNCNVISVVNVDGTIGQRTRLYFNAGEGTIAGVAIQKKQGDIWTGIDMPQTGKDPVATERGLAPYDWPVFPLLPENCSVFASYKDLQGDLKIRREVTQCVKKVEAVNAPPNSVLGRKGTELFEVTCHKGERLLFKQYWGDVDCWPVYGENSSMRYWKK